MRLFAASLLLVVLSLPSLALADDGADLATKLLGTWTGESADCKVRVDFTETEETQAENVVSFGYVLGNCGSIFESLLFPHFKLVQFEDRGGREIFAFRNVDADGFADADESGRYLSAKLDAEGDLVFGFGGWAAFGDAYAIDARVVYLSKQAP